MSISDVINVIIALWVVAMAIIGAIVFLKLVFERDSPWQLRLYAGSAIVVMILAIVGEFLK
jgi:hypothetical protein